MNPSRPPRPTEPPYPFLSRAVVGCAFLFLFFACVPSSVRREEAIKSLIRENLFSTEHLAFGADPRSVSAVKAATTEDDIPILIRILADSSLAVAAVAQYVLVGYDQLAIPYLNAAMSEHPSSAGRVEETLIMIRKRETNSSN